MTTVLYRNGNGNGGHQYLDSETNYFYSEKNYIDTESLQVVHSLDEYSLRFWEEHFNTCNNPSIK